MKAANLLDLTRGAHALQAALAAKLEMAIVERDEAQGDSQHADRCLREIEKRLWPDVDPAPDSALWRAKIVDNAQRLMHDLHARIADLEADLAATVRRTEQ